MSTIPTPEEAPIITTEVNQPYARRTTSAFTWGAFAILALFIFVGWKLWTEPDDSKVLQDIIPDLQITDSTPTGSDFPNGLVAYAHIANVAERQEETQSNIDLAVPAAYVELKKYGFDALLGARVLDFEGRMVGVVDRVEKTTENDLIEVGFVVDPFFAEYKGQRFSVPYKSFHVARSMDGYDLILNEDQTRSLAEQLLF